MGKHNDIELQAVLNEVPGSRLVDVLLPGLSQDAAVRTEYQGMISKQNKQQRFAAAVRCADSYREGKLTMSYPEAGGSLWSVLAAEVVDAYDEVQLPLTDFAWEVHPEIAPGRAGQQAEVSIYVDLGGHTTLKNAQEYGKTATGSGKLVSIKTNAFTTEGEVSETELRNFGALKRRLGSMINDHRRALALELGAVVQAVAPASCSYGGGGGKTECLADKAGRLVLPELTADAVAKQVYPLFPAGVDMLCLGVDAYARLMAVKQDDFPLQDGSWGIAKFRKLFPVPQLDVEGMKAWGMALKRNAIAWAACQPFVDEGMGLTHWEPLGMADGVPLWLNVWYDHAHRIYKMSVNSQVGFAVANTQGLYLLSEVSA